MSERSVHMPAESRGEAPGRGRLAGRRVLVVGGGQMDIGEADTPIGNGRAISVLFAREGAGVAVADRDGLRARKRAWRWRLSAKMAKRFAIAADASKEDDVTRMVDEAAARDGRLDALVLNVGIGAGGPWLEGTTPNAGTKCSR
jgi:NAD(P)-dependent dehydrogenase (short-subunit alcohol dehydrogenase family)